MDTPSGPKLLHHHGPRSADELGQLIGDQSLLVAHPRFVQIPHEEIRGAVLGRGLAVDLARSLAALTIALIVGASAGAGLAYAGFTSLGVIIAVVSLALLILTGTTLAAQLVILDETPAWGEDLRYIANPPPGAGTISRTRLWNLGEPVPAHRQAHHRPGPHTLDS